MNWNRVLGALLGGAARPPRRRIRRSGLPIGGGGNMALARTLARLATVAIEAMNRPSQSPTPAPRHEAPAPRGAGSAPRGAGSAPRGAGSAPRGAGSGRSARLPEWTTAPAPSPYTPPAETPDAPLVEEVEGLLLIRAMIAAAKADGSVDAEERRAIAEQLDSAGLSAEERDFILADFERPLTPDALARQATDPMMRARLYAGAVAAMDEISAPERAWLDELAKALGLDRRAAAAIEERLST
ncbi:tellurite resistance TerB family protein [Roseomonas frigidaquae]|uniref:Tellurite resistance TerB family protein n=1 Tax=Falsiroseomonas frigidaquae TaxID=487318 RepID=A0ABX1F107_9PROT|nr:DUF533 domain-containing protein [Falsiroseomonas frigidaquae]NKE46011.1 tellurite resistance TerB family protein [Falsiroseomonas frigidaquae]